MVEDIHFLDEGKVIITAASVGISKLRWISVLEEEDNGQAHIQIMKDGRYDHLPVTPKNGVITEYYKTIIPDNFNEIEKHNISYNDVIPLDTNIEVVIDKFYREKRTFYFLSFNDDISGLITIGNLNCKQVQIYIFSLICELEKELAFFVNFHLSHKELLDWLKEKAIAFEQKNVEDKCKNNKYQSIINQYEELVESGLENDLTEHLFLIDFLKIILDKKLFQFLSFSKKQWKEYTSLNELRHKIAHPTRSLLDKDQSIQQLGKRLIRIREMLFQLRKFKRINDYKWN